MERCLQLVPDEAIVVRAVRQHYGQETFLMAHAEEALGSEEEEDSALTALIEALLDGCEESATGQPAWLVDAGVREAAVAALASSLGCGVVALDPEGTRELETARCINAPTRPFKIVPALADVSSANVTLPEHVEKKPNSSRVVTGVRIDSLFSQEGAGAASGVAPAGERIALLRLAPRRCCGVGAALRGLQGARGLLESRQVRCVATEMALDGSAPELLRLLLELEHLGYQLLHAGPVNMPGQEPADGGSYAVYRTDAEQLRELHSTFVRIRRFDERTGSRAYGDGLSLSRDGQYFDLTDFVVACQAPLPKRLVVRDKAGLRFHGGRWLLEEGNGTGGS